MKFTKKLNLCCTYILNILLYYTLLYITFRTNPEIYIWYDNFFVDYNIVIHYELCLSAIFIISKYVSFFFVFFFLLYIYYSILHFQQKKNPFCLKPKLYKFCKIKQNCLFISDLPIMLQIKFCIRFFSQKMLLKVRALKQIIRQKLYLRFLRFFGLIDSSLPTRLASK